MPRCASARLFPLVFVLVASIATVSAQVPEGLVGAWTLNVANSTYQPGPPPNDANDRSFPRRDDPCDHQDSKPGPTREYRHSLPRPAGWTGVPRIGERLDRDVSFDFDQAR